MKKDKRSFHPVMPPIKYDTNKSMIEMEVLECESYGAGL